MGQQVCFIENSGSSRGDIIIQNSVMRLRYTLGEYLLSDGIMVGGTASATEKLLFKTWLFSRGSDMYLFAYIPKSESNTTKFNLGLKR